ncbi:hypothetical protein [Streptomyces roseochromogenus]|uniref:Uncharacterized protein n=1 Tax=Streptomyces roseochromogenus subsp. oscitans DS 12.976 TaxID=1352936 RepID=V6KX97_STRRC|nr:hypothetical protein [Streptomyces roseochromogenus]EST36737.1 hypothetical protein M878_00410 [Streptomyces roseochromogenus subsp. oscitans DS 12.976]
MDSRGGNYRQQARYFAPKAADLDQLLLLLLEATHGPPYGSALGVARLG